MSKRVLHYVVSIIAVITLSCSAVDADLPYNSYAFDVNGKVFSVQSPYVPVEIIGNYFIVEDEEGNEVSIPGIKGPRDIFIDDNNDIYVADTDNNRIVRMNTHGEYLGEYSLENDPLSSPEGLCVDKKGNVYVADTGKERVLVFDSSSGDLVREISKPDDIRLQNVKFSPVKIAVDVRGFLFVLIRGASEGVMVITADGEFAGYFGSNAVELNIFQKFRRIIYSSEQIKRLSGEQAPIINDITIGPDGFIYTVTRNLKNGQIKKFNSIAEDLFDDKNFLYENPDNSVPTTLSSIAVDDHGNVYSVDSANGVIYEYDSNGDPLFAFGRSLSDNQYKVGVFGDATSISVDDDNNLYVLDRLYNGIHVLRTTEFAQGVHKAIKLYADGRYDESEVYWSEVLKLNVNYYKANLGIGKAMYSDKAYFDALEQFQIADEKVFYSDALWEIRLLFMQKYFGWMASGGILLFIAALLYIKLRKKHRREK